MSKVLVSLGTLNLLLATHILLGFPPIAGLPLTPREKLEGMLITL